MCGGCTDQHLKLYRFSNNISQNIFDFHTFDGFIPTIKLNDSTIFPKKSQSKIYNCLNFKENDEYWTTIKVKWNKSNTELLFTFIYSDYDSQKETETYVERARLILKFIKRGKNYYFKTNKPTSK